MERGGRDRETNRGRETLLDARFGLAQSKLRALLAWDERVHAGRKERPKLFTSHQKGELQALVGPEWRQLGVDIEQHKKWSARAVELLQAIDGTPDRALSDVHWTALLSQAHEAVRQVQVMASQIEIPSATLRSPHSFVRVHEGPGGLTKDWLTQAPLGPGTSIRNREFPDWLIQTPQAPGTSTQEGKFNRWGIQTREVLSRSLQSAKDPGRSLRRLDGP